jgi:uncharacterized membrane protein
MEEVALFLHLLGALTFTAGIVVAGLAFESARRRERPEEIALLLSLSRFGVLLVASGGLLLLGFGLWLVELADVGYDAGWVQAAIGLFVLAVILGAAGGRRPKQARLIASRLADDGAPLNAELQSLLDDRPSRAANYLSAALVVAILALMAFKP